MPTNTPINLTFSDIFNSLPLIVFLIDSSRTILDLNHQALDFLKVSKDLVQGQKIGNAIECRNLQFSAEQCGETVHCPNCRLFSIINQTISTGLPAHKEEISLKRSQDSPVVYALLSTMTFHQGKTLIISIEDITSLRNAYNEMTCANKYAENIIESVHDILIVTDQDHRINRVNRKTEALLEYKAQELIGRPFDMLLKAADGTVSVTDAELFLSEIGMVDLDIVTKSGTMIPARCSRSPLLDPEGYLTGYVMVAKDLRHIRNLMTDLRDLKETHKKLVHVERLSTAGILAAGISHTIGNVLTNLKSSLTGTCEEANKLMCMEEFDRLLESSGEFRSVSGDFNSILNHHSLNLRSSLFNELKSLNSAENPAEQYRHLRDRVVRTAVSRIHSYTEGLIGQVDFMDENIKGLLSLSKKDRIEKNRVSLFKVLRTSRSMLNNYEKSGITFIEDIRPDTPDLFIHFHRMLDCILNLMINGIEAMPDGGTLAYGTEMYQEGYVDIFVRDTGKGIPDSIAGRISEPFFSTKASGTGLGLSMVYSYTEEIGGTVSLKTSIEGTEFRLKIPYAKEHCGEH